MSDQSDEMTITLPVPVSVPGADAVTELRLRAPTAGEWSKADKIGGVDGDILLVSLVAGIPSRAVEQIPAYIVNRASRYMMGFFDPLPATGSAS